MEYYTYWSIHDSPSSTASSTIFLIILILSLCLFLSILKFKKSDFEKKLYLTLSGLFLIISCFGYFYLKLIIEDDTRNEKRLNELLDAKTLQKVEGKISNYQRTVVYVRNGKDTSESFTVGSVGFRYIDNALYEFNHFGGNHSGTFYNGLRVRITYIKGDEMNEIKKIEIASKQ
ncbi:hypothetical protein LUD75_03275 [Epilithonimonas sp. JDS]|uniref:hypothetical protein n=1 Tax=Epilithonimonas sp. JDS TaxID=2902797 RepID=UPI001E315286|nr:hypothetical protein [Epilithonimonas sp. JDS]MCD9853708.1 hypothetical protein [Epilithonimonas sp. JDS]